jgi:UDP-glucose:glycoprotein glucosyltransferase
LNALQSGVGQALQHFQEKVGLNFFSTLPAHSDGYFNQVYTGAITEDDADDIENYFYDLPTTMKRRNRHVVPLGNGVGVRVVNLPSLHRGAGLRASPASFIYPSKIASDFSHLCR